MLTNLLPAKILTSSIQATDMLGKAVYPYLCLRVNQSIIFANKSLTIGTKGNTSGPYEAEACFGFLLNSKSYLHPPLVV